MEYEWENTTPPDSPAVSAWGITSPDRCSTIPAWDAVFGDVDDSDGDDDDWYQISKA